MSCHLNVSVSWWMSTLVNFFEKLCRQSHLVWPSNISVSFQHGCTAILIDGHSQAMVLRFFFKLFWQGLFHISSLIFVQKQKGTACVPKSQHDFIYNLNIFSYNMKNKIKHSNTTFLWLKKETITAEINNPH